MIRYPYPDIKQPEGKYPRPATEEELHALFENTMIVEKYYPSDEIFSGACRQIVELPTKEKLLQSIASDMTLRKSFFTKVYGYEISYPGYADKAIKMLEDAGCSKASKYYEQIVSEHEKERDEKLKPVAQTLKEQINIDYERKQGDELRVGKYSSSLQQKNYSKKQKENSVAKLNRLKALI